MAYALLYPAINAVQHQTWSHIPAFGVPCPTTIFTAGMLLLARERSWRLATVPVLWAAIGGSAAVLLGVHADLALPVAGLALALGVLDIRRRGRRGERERLGSDSATKPRGYDPATECRKARAAHTVEATAPGRLRCPSSRMRPHRHDCGRLLGGT